MEGPKRYDTNRMSTQEILDAMTISEAPDSDPGVTSLPCPNNACVGGRVISAEFSILCPACHGNMVVTAKEFGDYQLRLHAAE